MMYDNISSGKSTETSNELNIKVEKLLGKYFYFYDMMG